MFFEPLWQSSPVFANLSKMIDEIPPAILWRRKRVWREGGRGTYLPQRLFVLGFASLCQMTALLVILNFTHTFVVSGLRPVMKLRVHVGVKNRYAIARHKMAPVATRAADRLLAVSTVEDKRIWIQRK